MAQILERTRKILDVVADLSHEDAIVVLMAAMGARAEHDGRDPVEIFKRCVSVAAMREVQDTLEN